MVGIKGIGGIPEPAPDRPANVRDRKKDDAKTAQVQDGVRISSEAQKAADATRLVEMAAKEPDIRAERVQAAKEAIERGDYKLPNVIAEVARKISKYMP